MAESRKQGASISAILASTAASISVCLLLVVLADDQPAVMLDWGRLQESQMMGAYNLARRAGDAQLVKADATLSAPVVKASKSAAPQKLSSMQQAVNELKHLKKIANDVWPSGASKHHKLAQSSTQMLAHYKQLSSDAWPSHAAAHGKRSAQTAEQELAELRKVSSLGLPSSKSSTHSSWHQTAHDLFAHYKSITSKSLPDTVAEKKKTAMSAEQELAHYKKLSSEIWPSEHSAVQHKESAHEMLAHYKAVTDATSPSHSVQTKARVAKLSASGHLAASHVRPHSPHAKSQKLSRTIAGGLEITDVTEGTGPEPKVGDKITVHYTGKLTSGKVFDSGDISFQFGEGQVIKGWDIGLEGMKEGGERKLVIPPGLAYGSRGTPGGPIPPDATLDFDVKLLKV